PLERFRDEIAQWASATTGTLAQAPAGGEVTVGGIVTALRLIKTKKGDRMASFLLEDLEGSVETLVFPEAYKKAAGRLADDQVVLVKGRAEVLDDGRTRSTIYRDPLGVCAAITPWNFPFAMPHWMVFPALLAGNTVVLKPSEETPLIAQAYAELVRALVPDGVLQVVHGADDQGKALVAADVDLIAFTGSRAVGKHIMAAAAGGLKRIILELGGKDPLLVLDSADVDKAAAFAARNSFRNAGQVCVATERIYVARALAERFVSKLSVEAAKMTVGNGLDEASKVGPMVSARQRDHVLRQVADAVAKGATVVRGGEHDGLFVQPTVLTGVTPEMGIAQEETFGPVACVTVVDSDEEAVRLANATRYGLGAVVFGADDAHTADIARRLNAGMIGVNQGVYGARGTPWVGARESGFAFHSSRDGHRNFTQTRVVSRPKT
ncbi:MAG: aldehyde dehydrogenase, partial [Kofleriaceae bacterium]